jgi:glycosyltransferase involved in cell wall biosynthesis
MKPIRVLHLITGLNTGGAEIALLRLLSKMDRQKFDLHIVSMIPVGPIGEKIRALGLPVSSLGMQPGHPTLEGFRQLLVLLKRFRPDILQTWLYHADFMGLLAARLAGVQTVIWNIRSAEMDFLQYRWLSGQVVRLCAILSDRPTAVIVNSRAGQTIHTRLGYHPKEWIFLPNGIDTELFQPNLSLRNQLRAEWNIAEDELLVGIVGRVDPQKDHTTFVKSVALALKERPKLRFVCVGSGPLDYQQKMKELSAQLGLDRLHWAGPRTDMPAVYNALDVLVSSSIGEGFPNVVAEAMACEKPCVVTTVGDSAILVAETGICVSPGNPEALAESLLRMLALPTAERLRLGQKARQRIAENFSLQKMVNEYTALYERFGKNPDPSKPSA